MFLLMILVKLWNPSYTNIPIQILNHYIINYNNSNSHHQFLYLPISELVKIS